MQPKAVSLPSHFIGDARVVLDFSDPNTFKKHKPSGLIIGVTNSGFGHNLPTFGTPPEPYQDEVEAALHSTTPDQQLVSQTPLLPVTGSFTLAWSHKAESEGRKAVIWQHTSGEVGRTQIVANAAANAGATYSEQNGKTQIFIGGISDGAGPHGMIKPVSHPIGQWKDYVLLLQEGPRASQLWADGQLVDHFTRPIQFPNTNTTLFQNPHFVTSTGLAIGRVLVLERAARNTDIPQIQNWLRSTFPKRTSDNLTLKARGISAKSALVQYIPQDSSLPNLTLYSKAADTPIPPASVTKLLTAITAIRILEELKIDVDHYGISVTAADEVGGSARNVSDGDILLFNDTLFNMLLPSSNRMATAVARNIGELLLRSEGRSGGGLARFVLEMNNDSKRIGLQSSRFENVTGFNASKQITTALDMCALIAYASRIARITNVWGTAQAELAVSGLNARVEMVKHRLEILSDPDVIGGKTGSLWGKINNLALFVRAPDGGKLVVSVMQARTTSQRYEDARAIIDAVVNGTDWSRKSPTPLHCLLEVPSQ